MFNASDLRKGLKIEIDGVPMDIAKEALRLGAQKLPIKTKFVKRD
jgi:ribosomal protein L16/L10AE